MKLRIVSDGTRHGTMVVDDATNELVENVTAIDWHIGENGHAEGVVRIANMGADISGEIRRLLE